MEQLGEQFRLWVMAQEVAGAHPVCVDDDHIRIAADAATAEVNLYPYADGREIVELRIERADGEVAFFLHFMLDDLGRAQELFGQMIEALAEENERETTHVLLTCSSALTTTLFASKMDEVAQTLGLDYDFCAMSVENALATTEPFSAILLAPQVAHVRKEMMRAHPNALVFEIPAKIFGSYNAAGAMRLLLQAFRDSRAAVLKEGPAGPLVVQELDDDRRVLVITVFSMRDHTRLGYRLYDGGEVMLEGTVLKPRLDYRDIEDLLQSICVRKVDLGAIDAIGIAVPGVASHGFVSLPGLAERHFDLGQALSERFGLPVFVENNCNAAAVGCYVGQNEFQNLVFYRHAFGHVAGGMGTIIEGKLLKGHGNSAGEPNHFERLYAFDMPYEDAYWSSEGIQLLALNVTLTACAIVAPDAVYLAVDTVDDAEEFEAELVRELGQPNAPRVHMVRDYPQRVYLGTLALALHKLRRATR